MHLTRVLSLVLAVAGSVALAADSPSRFRASFAQVDVTPTSPKWLLGYGARQSTGVHDRIFHKVAALDDGATQFYLVSSDFCLFAPSLYDDFTAQLKRETGIDRLHVWWTVTHTHSAPEIGPFGMPKAMMPDRYTHDIDQEYTTFVVKSLIETIKQARAKLEPARLASGTGYSAANINRRGRDPEGKISLGLNPDGPTDRQIGIIRLERPDGKPIALIANYAMHGTALGPKNTLISGDAPGGVATYVENKLGAPMLYINGAAGDLAPIYSVQENFSAAHIKEFNVLLGDRILAANASTATTPVEIRMRAGEKVVLTPRKKGLGWDPGVGDYLDASAGENGSIKLPLRFLMLHDDLAIWAAPVEMFCQIALDVRNRSPYRHTFYFGYTNGWLGYLTTKQGFHEGGYEPRTSPFTDSVEDEVTKAALTWLQGRGR